MNNLKYNIFNFSKIELKSKIFSVNQNKLKIFPNGNILFHDDKDIRIFDPKKLKSLFTFSFDHIDEVIILSNNSLLLKFFQNDISMNNLIIMNFSKEKIESLKKIDIILEKNKKFGKEEYLLHVKKLNNNRIFSIIFIKIGKKTKKY